MICHSNVMSNWLDTHSYFHVEISSIWWIWLVPTVVTYCKATNRSSIPTLSVPFVPPHSPDSVHSVDRSAIVWRVSRIEAWLLWSGQSPSWSYRWRICHCRIANWCKWYKRPERISPISNDTVNKVCWPHSFATAGRNTRSRVNIAIVIQ